MTGQLSDSGALAGAIVERLRTGPTTIPELSLGLGVFGLAIHGVVVGLVRDGTIERHGQAVRLVGDTRRWPSCEARRGPVVTGGRVGR